MRDKKKRKPMTEETKRKLSATRKARGLKPEKKCREACVKALKGKRGNRWRGGKRNATGYLEICLPSHPQATKAGYVREHRLIMEKHIGRPLTRKEIVHHINGNLRDNRIENLMLYSVVGHARYHAKIRWKNKKKSFQKFC